MPGAHFVKRVIALTFYGGPGAGVAGTFTGTVVINAGGDTTQADPMQHVYPGERITCHITNAGDPGQGIADILIWGLSIDTMNSLLYFTAGIGQTLGRKVGQNQIAIQAGDDANGMHTVFTGMITQAWPDMQLVPLGPFHIVAQGAALGLGNLTPKDWDGPAQASSVCEYCVGQMLGGVKFENNGVTAMLDSPYVWESPLHAIRRIAHAGSFGYVLDNDLTLAIYKSDGDRGYSGFVIGPTLPPANTLMVGYPSFTQNGILVKYEHTVPIKIYETFQVTGSQIDAANNTWQAVRVDYSLECNTPRGQWFATVEGMIQGGDP